MIFTRRIGKKQLHREWYMFDQGVEKGIEKTKFETAKRLLEMGFSIADAAKVADLDYSTVGELA